MPYKIFVKQYWEKYKPLILFGLITIAIFSIGFISEVKNIKEFFTQFWQFFSVLDTLTAIALALLAAMAYFEYAKGEDEIKIYLDVEGEKKDTQLRLLRKDVNRGEVLGILGMIQNKNSGRFENSKFRNKETLLEFLNNIMEVQKGNRNEIVIPISKEDFEQYFSEYFNKS